MGDAIGKRSGSSCLEYSVVALGFCLAYDPLKKRQTKITNRAMIDLLSKIRK